MDEQLVLLPIGVVHSPVADRRLMPPQGVPAEIEIFSAYQDGLLLIEENSHLWIIGWFTESDRQRLQIVRPEYEPARRRRGVFGLRSVARPNPLSLTATRLVGRSGNRLHVDPLDLIDGTLVLDIKRYSPSLDCIFSARSSRDRYMLDITSVDRLLDFEVEAANFHGEHCPDVVVAARLIQQLAVLWNIRPKDDGLQLVLGTHPALAHLADALQAITGATFGSGRLRVEPGRRVLFRLRSRWLSAIPLPLPSSDPVVLRRLPLSALVTLEASNADRVLLPTEGSHSEQ